MAPTRRQAIILTNDDEFTDSYMRHSAIYHFMAAIYYVAYGAYHLLAPTC